MILPVTGAIAAAHGDVPSGVLTAAADDTELAAAVGCAGSPNAELKRANQPRSRTAKLIINTHPMPSAAGNHGKFRLTVTTMANPLSPPFATYVPGRFSFRPLAAARVRATCCTAPGS